MVLATPQAAGEHSLPSFISSEHVRYMLSLWDTLKDKVQCNNSHTWDDLKNNITRGVMF
jgi:hypothetical protein